jgi:glyoxylase-like metal-dependent hydrolase (beta-lactamase superfamily II)
MEDSCRRPTPFSGLQAVNVKLLPTLLTFGLLATPLLGADFDIKVDRLSPRVAVLSGGPWGNAIVALATQKGIVVIDAPFSRTIASGFRGAIAAEFKRNDFACLINTHEHTCHVSGNSAYSDVPIVGHESIRADMLKSMADPAHKFSTASRLGLADRQLNGVRARLGKTNPEQLKTPGWANYEKAWKLIIADWSAGHVTVPPTITFDHRATLTFGDVTVRLDYFGCSHGIGDTIVSVPEENLVVTAGVFYANLVPEINPNLGLTAATVENWLVVLRDLLGRTDEHTRFLASHDATPMNQGQIRYFASYLEDLWAEARRAREAGDSLAQLKARLPLTSRFPEMAKLTNSNLVGTEWEVQDLHSRNIDVLWKALTQ